MHDVMGRDLLTEDVSPRLRDTTHRDTEFEDITIAEHTGVGREWGLMAPQDRLFGVLEIFFQIFTRK